MNENTLWSVLNKEIKICNDTEGNKFLHHKLIVNNNFSSAANNLANRFVILEGDGDLITRRLGYDRIIDDSKYSIKRICNLPYLPGKACMSIVDIKPEGHYCPSCQQISPNAVTLQNFTTYGLKRNIDPSRDIQVAICHAQLLTGKTGYNIMTACLPKLDISTGKVEILTGLSLVPVRKEPIFEAYLVEGKYFAFTLSENDYISFTVFNSESRISCFEEMPLEELKKLYIKGYIKMEAIRHKKPILEDITLAIDSKKNRSKAKDL